MLDVVPCSANPPKILKKKKQAKRTEKLITKSKRGQDRVHFQSSEYEIIAAFLLKVEKIMKFAGFFHIPN
jgi:hypothetical protein